MRRIVIFIINIYKYAFSPFFAYSCRYTPSCSSYAIEAIERYGVLKGGWMAMRRVSRCHPWHEGGLDPVPTQRKRNV